jgi:hypothetical protein
VSKIVELGCAGHFICSDNCGWRRHTQVGNYRISTVGDLYIEDKRVTVGCGETDYFETMVFLTTDKAARENDGCGCRAVVDWGGIEHERYSTAGEAQAGHEAMVRKYARKARS